MGKLLPAMTQEKLDTQRDVVKNERRWTMDNQPYGTWREKLPALCFPAGASVPSLADRLDGGSRRGEPRRRRAVLRDVLHAGQRGAVDRRRFRSGRSASVSSSDTSDAIPTRERASRRCPTCRCRRYSASGSARSCPTRSCCRAFSSRFARRRSERDEYYAASVCGAVLGLRNGEPTAAPSRARAPGRRRGDGVHLRSLEGERPARRRRHGAPRHCRRAARAGGCARDRRDRARWRDARRSRARGRADPDGVRDRRCSRPASAPIGFRCSRRTSAIPSS